MPEVLVETIPFILGAVLGFLSLSDRGLRADAVRIASGSVAGGALCSGLAGELGHDFLGSAAAVLADSAAVAVAWVGVQVAVRQGRALLRRA